MKQVLYKISWFVALAGWMGVIFYFSSQPDLKSDLPSTWDFIFRKIAHVSEYFVLCYLWYRALRAQNISVMRSLFVAIIASIIYAVTDEWHQSFVTNRHAGAIDIVIDSIGVFSAGVMLFYRERKTV